MTNPKHHGPHCAGLCEGQAYNSRIKELEGDNERLRGDAAEAEGVIREMYSAANRVFQVIAEDVPGSPGSPMEDLRAALALVKARGEQS